MGDESFQAIGVTTATFVSIAIPSCSSSQSLSLYSTSRGLGIMLGQGGMCPTFVEVDSFLAGNSNTTLNQLVHVARTFPDRARECCQAAFEVVIMFHAHGEEVPRLLEGTTQASQEGSMFAGGGHEGLCSRHQASVIAGVRTYDVLAKSGVPVTRK